MHFQCHIFQIWFYLRKCNGTYMGFKSQSDTNKPRDGSWRRLTRKFVQQGCKSRDYQFPANFHSCLFETLKLFYAIKIYQSLNFMIANCTKLCIQYKHTFSTCSSHFRLSPPDVVSHPIRTPDDVRALAIHLIKSSPKVMGNNNNNCLK